jgi:hypothetical protein
VTSGANQTAGVPARATLGVRSRQNWSLISAPAHRNSRSARWSHPTLKNSQALQKNGFCNEGLLRKFDRKGDVFIDTQLFAKIDDEHTRS